MPGLPAIWQAGLGQGLPCLPWRDFLGKYRHAYIIYKSWQYSLSIACQACPPSGRRVWARGATRLIDLMKHANYISNMG